MLFGGGIYDMSDIRLKENLVLLENGIEKVSSLKGVYFNNDSGLSSSREVGIFARDIETQMPELIKTNKNGHKTVDYVKLMPVLIEAIKELKIDNDILKLRLDLQEEILGQYQNTIAKKVM